MINYSELERVPLREIWPHEASNFTPWLADHIEALGDELGLELELTRTEALVGDFSLDILAKDLNSSSTVIIENQLSNTDHDHLGKLLTYAAGYNASTIVWVLEDVKPEHRNALEWLNQKTDIDTQFFAVTLEVRKIDESRKIFRFDPIVSPNAWQKARRQFASANPSPREERYREYFQRLSDELSARRIFISGHFGASKNRYYFPSGIRGGENLKIDYRAAFAGFGRSSKVSASIYMTGDDHEQCFSSLENRMSEINLTFSGELEWERRDDQKHSTISVYRDGHIGVTDSELDEIREWHIEILRKLKEVFTPEIGRALETIDNGEV